MMVGYATGSPRVVCNYGTSEGIRKAWDTRGRKSVPSAAGRMAETQPGFTVHAVSGEIPDSGHVVGGIVPSVVVPVHPGMRTEALIRDFMLHHKAELSKPDRYMGGWLHNGELHLDVADRMPDRKSALATARQRDEIAIFDLGKKQQVFTMSDEKRPSASKGKPVRNTSKATGAQGTPIHFLVGRDKLNDPKGVAKFVDGLIEQHFAGKKK